MIGGNEMGKVRVVNMRGYKVNANEQLIKVDRSTIVGNPFYMASEGERNKVCDMYEIYFIQQMKTNKAFKKYIMQICETALHVDVALGCWCAPKRCHAETIKAFVDAYVKQVSEA